jgi:diaminopimelate epimerase
MIRFSKYHALGNDYVVVEDAGGGLTPPTIRRICDRHLGIGADGVLLPTSMVTPGEFRLRIFNPDGSEAEKSGNGLRIFARYLLDNGRVDDTPFRVHTAGGLVQCQVKDGGSAVAVDMGRASFDSTAIPVSGPRREVLRETMDVLGTRLEYSAVTIGNPHCVVFRKGVSEADAKRFGPHIENDPRFPNRTNVQFVEVLDRDNLRIEIWERGAGYTLASGSSSCAAVAVAHRLGFCGSAVTVHMAGGPLSIQIGPEWSVHMIGPVVHVADGILADESLHGAS